MDLESLTANLRRIRSERDYSQADLAERAGLSKQGYHLIESGVSEPRSSTLSALARALRVPLAELLRPVEKLEHVRFRSEEPLRTRPAVEARVAAWLHDYRELEQIVGCEQQPPPKLKAHEAASPELAAVAARRRLGVAPGEPIRDACGLLEDNGVKVGTIPFATSRFFGLSIGPGGGGPAIVVNTWERITVERWIFTLAHELGHLMLHLGDYDASERDEDPAHEREADLFAACFLVPRDVFEKEWEQSRGLDIIDRVMKAKRMFRVSWRTILHRATELGDETAWGRFHGAYERKHGSLLERTEEPRALGSGDFRPSPATREPKGLDEADFREDRLMRLVRDAVEREHISLSRAAEILRMSLSDVRALSAGWGG